MSNNKFIIIVLLSIIFHTVIAQENPRNTGLKEPQKQELLPISNAKTVWPERKAKTREKSKLLSVNDNSYILTGGWEMIEAEKTVNDGAKLSLGLLNSNNWYNATVPGTVLTTLVEQGVYPDPYFGLNNLSIPDDLCRKEWWYLNQFDKPDLESGEQVWLLFNGINYEANIWLNGKMVGSIKGAFIRGNFEISDLLLEKNTLAVHIIPPPNPGIPHEASARSPRGPNGGELCQDGPTFISSEGWDWMPGIRDRNIGIWQDVRLKITRNARLFDPMIISDLDLPDTTKAWLTLKTEIETETSGTFFLVGEINNAVFSKKVELKKGKNNLEFNADELKQLQISNPKLWWPNGYGEQNLYTLKLTLKDTKKKIADTKTIRFGIRELSYEFAVSSKESDFQRINFNPIKAYAQNREALFDNINRVMQESGIVLPTLHEGINLNMFETLDGDNPYLIIKVNGVPIFCKGGNWGMDDAMKRVSRKRLEPYFKLHKQANYTMIRNWTGESTEEVFYELADEYGMLIWNDFWMSTEGYNMPPNDFNLFMQNATDVVKRFRNHPSIVIWCSRNEGYAPIGLDKPLANLIAKEDGTRMYLSNSRELNLRPSGPWNHKSDVNYYFADRAEGFSTEVGTQSFPTMESYQSMMAKEDLWPINDVWYYHDLHSGQEYFRANLIELFGEAFNLEDFNKKAQILNYRNHRAIFEAWNAKLWDNASGVLLWMTHPAWPSMIWQTYSWDYETYGAYFGAKKACEPIHIQLNNHDNKVLIINTTRKDYKNTRAVAVVYNLNGEQLQMEEKTLHSNANAKQECFSFIPNVMSDNDPYIIRLYLYNDQGHLLSQNTYWRSNLQINKFFKLNDLENAELAGNTELTIKGGIVKGKLTISNSGKTAAVNLKFNLRNTKSGSRILPAYFSDGYFTLLPGENRIIEFECDENLLSDKTDITVEAYNLPNTILDQFSIKKD